MPRLISMDVEAVDKDILNKAINLYKDREKNLNSFANDILFFFKNINPSEELKNKYLNNKSKNIIKVFLGEINNLNWTDNDINEYLKEFVKKQKIKFPEIAMPLRIIIAGTDNTPNIGSIIFILGVDVVKKRISVFI